jgi:hypothetical protein
LTRQHFPIRGADVLPGDAAAGTRYLHGEIRAPVVATTAEERLIRAFWTRPTRAERRVNSGAVERVGTTPDWPRRFRFPNERMRVTAA